MPPAGDDGVSVAEERPDVEDAERQEHPDSFDPGVETGYLRRGQRDHELPLDGGAAPFDPGSEVGYDSKRAKRAAKKRQEESDGTLEPRAEQQLVEPEVEEQRGDWEDHRSDWEEWDQREHEERERRLALERERHEHELAEREERKEREREELERQALLDEERRDHAILERREREAQEREERRREELERRAQIEHERQERAQEERERLDRERHERREKWLHEREAAEGKRREREQRKRQRQATAKRRRAKRQVAMAKTRQRISDATRPGAAGQPSRRQPARLRSTEPPRKRHQAPKLTRPSQKGLARPTAKAGLALAAVTAVAALLGAALGLPVPGLGSDKNLAASLTGAAPADAGTPVGLTKGPYFPVVLDAPANFGEGAALFGAPRSGHKHQGQDVFAKPGTPLVAVRDGIVMDGGGGESFYSYGGGNSIVIYSPIDDRSYVYLHMLKPALVPAGAQVHAGQVVGQVGCTGSCDGPHLHFEVRIGQVAYGDEKKALDPLPFMKQWPQVPQQ